jgi:hypothetical protein
LEKLAKQPISEKIETKDTLKSQENVMDRIRGFRKEFSK